MRRLPTFFTFFTANGPKMKIFLPPPVFHPFTLLLAPFSKTHQFQITLLLPITYIKNSPKLTPLQRLPCAKKVRCDPLWSPLFWQHKLCCTSTQVTLKLNSSYIEEQSKLSLLAKEPTFWPQNRLNLPSFHTFLNSQICDFPRFLVSSP